MDTSDLDNEKSMRRFLTTKYIIECSLMIAVFIAIFFFRYFNFFDNATTGTLFGAVTGYFLSDISKLHK